MPILEVKADVTGAVWKILVDVGERVVEGDKLIILESMKMEIPLLAPEDGIIKEVLVKKDEIVNEGETVAALEV